MTKCVWCGEPLRLDPQRGWVHADDGQVYKEDGHCALPDRLGMPTSMTEGISSTGRSQKEGDIATNV